MKEEEAATETAEEEAEEMTSSSSFREAESEERVEKTVSYWRGEEGERRR